MIRLGPVATPVALAGVLLLAACGGAGDADGANREPDPAVARALDAPLMSDPDLAGLNEANAALTGSGDHSLPTLVSNPEAVRQAQDQAIALLGGASQQPDLPSDMPAEDDDAPPALVLLEETATLVPGGARCLAAARVSAAWAARLPASLPVFPRGAVTEAFGQDGRDCGLRAVRFVTPVPAEDVVRFYLGMALKAGLKPEFSTDEHGWRLSGGTTGRAFIVRGRAALLGGLEIDVVTLGVQAERVTPR